MKKTRMNFTGNAPERDLPLKKAAGAVALFTGIFYINFASRIVLAPVLPQLEQDLAISHSQSGTLFLFISLGYLVSIFGSGWVSGALTHRRTITLSALLVGLALWGLAAAQNLFAMRAAALVIGLASGLYLPSGIASITSMVQKENWGKALGIHEVAPNLAFITVPLFFGLMAHVISWREAFFAWGAASLALALAFHFLGKGGHFKGTPPGRESLASAIKNADLWRMAALFSCGVASTAGLYSMMVLYLVETGGMEPGRAGLVLSASRASTLVMAFVAGWATDRFGPRRTMTVALLSSCVFTILIALARGPWLVAAVFLQPVLAVCFFPAAFATLSGMVSPQMRNVAISLVIPLGFVVGAGAVPALMGALAEMGCFRTGMATAGALIGLGGIGAIFFKPALSSS